MAGLLALVLLGLSLWFGYPRPQWRVPLNSSKVIALGFSADKQKVYSIKDFYESGKRIPKPMLQRWDLGTGILEAEYPLHVPDDDVSLMKPNSTETPSILYQPALMSDNLLYLQTPVGARFYDIESGQCLSQKRINEDWMWYTMRSAIDRHYMGIAVSTKNEAGTARLYDLTTGEILHAFEHGQSYWLEDCKLSSKQNYLLMSWRKAIPDQTRELDIFHTGTWKKIMTVPIPVPGGAGVGPLLEPDILIQTSYYFTDQTHAMKRLECFHFDPTNGSLKPETNHAFHGFVCPEWIYLQDNLLIRHGIRGMNQPRLPRWQALSKVLTDFVRQGKLPERPPTQDYYVYDFNNGQPLRQLTGLAIFAHQALHLRNDAKYVLGVECVGEPNKPSLQTFLTVYEIPHYLWEFTWNTAFYVAIVLIILWPFRFLRKRVAIEIPPVPPASALHP